MVYLLFIIACVWASVWATGKVRKKVDGNDKTTKQLKWAAGIASTIIAFLIAVLIHGALN